MILVIYAVWVLKSKRIPNPMFHWRCVLCQWSKRGRCLLFSLFKIRWGGLICIFSKYAREITVIVKSNSGCQFCKGAGLLHIKLYGTCNTILAKKIGKRNSEILFKKRTKGGNCHIKMSGNIWRWNIFCIVSGKILGNLGHKFYVMRQSAFLLFLWMKIEKK